ncbi:hypothetical protein [Bacillus capparidis]|nr:hypothetical protein [Bacillus capparidis]MBP1083045.1 hypothetical protein [Bacillus capparidis]MED1097986.1 hypothetical protein [Bacillus capparidis]
MEENVETELKQRAYYLGAPLTSVIILHLVLYSSSFSASKANLDLFKGTKSIQINFRDYVVNLYNDKPRYNHQLHFLISYHLNKVVKKTNEQWKSFKADKKQRLIFNTYLIDKQIINNIKDFKDKTGLSLTVIINYAAILDLQDQISNVVGDKQPQGFQLSESIIGNLTQECENKNLKLGYLLGEKLEILINSLSRSLKVRA